MIQAKGNRLFLFTHDAVGPPQQIHRCRKCGGALRMNTKEDHGEKLLATGCINCDNHRERVIAFRPTPNMVQAKNIVPCIVVECDKGTIPKAGRDGLCADCKKLNDR